MFDVLFGILLFAGCAYAAAAGGRDGFRVAVALVAAAVLSIPAGHLAAWNETQLPVFVVDLVLLGILVDVAFRSTAFWPLWTTAFHLLSIASHVATIAEPRIKPMLYFNVQAFWSLPCILVMVLGVMIDRETRSQAHRT